MYNNFLNRTFKIFYFISFYLNVYKKINKIVFLSPLLPFSFFLPFVFFLFSFFLPFVFVFLFVFLFSFLPFVFYFFFLFFIFFIFLFFFFVLFILFIYSSCVTHCIIKTTVAGFEPTPPEEK